MKGRWPCIPAAGPQNRRPFPWARAAVPGRRHRPSAGAAAAHSLRPCGLLKGSASPDRSLEQTGAQPTTKRPATRETGPEQRSEQARPQRFSHCDRSERTGRITSLSSRTSGRPSCRRFWASATALKSRFHFASPWSSAGSRSLPSGAMRLGIWAPVTASASAWHTCSIADVSRPRRCGSHGAAFSRAFG